MIETHPKQNRSKSMYGRTLTTKTNSSAMVNLSGHAWVGVDLITYPVLIGAVEVVR